MKTTGKYICIALALASVLSSVACTADYLDESDYPMAPGTGDVPVLDFDGQDAVSVSKDGGEYEFSFVANLPWMVESRASWITVTSETRGSGGTDPVKVTFSVTRNASIDPREGEIRVWITDDAEHIGKVAQEATPSQELGHSWYVKADGTGDGSSWESPTTLSNALAAAVDNDKIYVAAGIHYPTNMIAGGSQAKDNTFYVSSNVSITGGFPADAKEGDVSDPEKNVTVLSGDIEDGPTYHVMVVAAPKSDVFSVNVEGVTITGGLANTSAQTITVNGAAVHRSYGAGVVVGNSNATFSGCIICGNESPGFNAGVYNTGGSVTRLENCLIEDNESGGNGCAVWNAATIYMDGCTVQNNTNTGVGCGLYNFDNGSPVSAYVYNTAFLSNRTDGSRNSRRGGGFYGRESSRTVMVNCTFDGNFGGNGAAVALYGTAAAPSELTMVSCTVTGNESMFVGGGVEAGDYTTLNVYNSVISGNTDTGGYPDLVVTSSNNGTSALPAVLSYSINGAVVYGKDKTVVSGTSFDFSTMLGALNDGVRALAGENNPAMTYGMPPQELAAVSAGMTPDIDAEVLAEDQKGNIRSGNVMGAYVGD